MHTVLETVVGFWHSAPGSTLIHRCPQSTACGGAGAESYWQDLIMMSSGPAAPAGGTNTSTPQVAKTAEADTVNLGLNDFRSEWLSRCQQEGYEASYEEQGMHANGSAGSTKAGDPALPGSFNSSSDSTAALPGAAISVPTTPTCQLMGRSNQEASAYMQQQCTPGYTGNLCAACQPGYFINTAFECRRCPNLVPTAGLWVLAFLATMVLVLYTVSTTLRDNCAAADGTYTEGVDASDILKVCSSIPYDL
ncbi:hypothetical protein TSOC_010751 [Tetrabaena socialis]|uniref:Tyrosine-protein kinase ephrin type A/B receptor-like domain-containing protein n=1 Tax=Tetrabaena socialis TaxID=47790 RepID=A0A2J7ZSF9_9CHLO|nr:hypothetical protein TSOC_010751 [Tetrabaena socialis]|eukprot:PNH03207.1 hypothetical protein TSOC_010751 [Tetrabaena socialis]